MNGETIFQDTISGFFTPLYQLIVMITFLYFLYGVLKFVYDMRDPEKKNFGKSHLFWGLIGLFIILSAGAIIPLFNSVLGGSIVF
jgi:hypothetical protein